MRPPLTSMVESIHEAGRDEAMKYFRKAKGLSPELHRSGYLKRIWRKFFDERFGLEKGTTRYERDRKGMLIWE